MSALWMNPRAPAATTASVILGALALQHVMGWLPCPLCVLQRLSMIGVLLALLLWAPEHPRRKLWLLAGLAFCMAGVAAAITHLYLLAAPQTASCGPGLALTISRLVEALPAGAWLLEGAGACDDARYVIFGLPLPLYSLVAHVGAVYWALMIQRKAKT